MELHLNRKPKIRIITKRQLKRKLNSERYHRKKDKEFKSLIFKSLFFSIQYNEPLSDKEIYLIHIKNYLYYLLDKLKNKNIIDYFIFYNLKKKYIMNCEKNGKYMTYIITDFMLYNLLWSKCIYKYFYNFTEEIYKFFFYKKQISKNENIIYNYFKYTKMYKNYYYTLIKNYNYNNSIIILFFEYLNEIKINSDIEINKLKDNEYDFIKYNDLKNDFFDFLYNDYYIEGNFDFTEIDYSNYLEYIDLNISKKIYILPLRSKFLDEIYIEELLLKYKDIYYNPFKTIDFFEYSKYIEDLNISDIEKNFQLNLCNIFNINLDLLNISINTNDLKIKKNIIYDDLLNTKFENILDFKDFEESKIFSDVLFELNFFNKTTIQFIELCLFKLQDFFSCSFLEILLKLYSHIENQFQLISFYNILVKDLKEKLNYLNLNDIIFIIEFLEFFYLLCKNINNYNFNILNFNLYKLKLVIGDIKIFSKNFYKKIFFYKNEKSYNYIDFLFNIYSVDNIYDNLNYYFNFYQFFFSNSLNILEKHDLSLIKNLKYQNINFENNYIKIFFDNKRKKDIINIYNMFSQLDLRFALIKRRKKYKTIYLHRNKRFFDYIDFIMSSEINLNILYILNSYLIQNIYKYKMVKLFENLNHSFLNLTNLDLLHINIKTLKKNVLLLEESFILVSKNILNDVYKYYILNDFNIYNFNFWYIFVNTMVFKYFKDILIKNKLFELIFIYFFSSLTVHYNHPLIVDDLLIKYKRLITIYKEKREKVKNQKKLEVNKYSLQLNSTNSTN